MKKSTLNQIQGVLVEAGRTDLAEEMNSNKILVWEPGSQKAKKVKRDIPQSNRTGVLPSGVAKKMSTVLLDRANKFGYNIKNSPGFRRELLDLLKRYQNR